ncbi:MAG TPA: cysteine desulfurase family protein [Bryobacteraceae bacterium]|nr:cysteine desulfurase family protein [Bryobacteraceae bacterium]
MAIAKLEVEKAVERCYFDHNATSPVAPAVIDAMLPVLRDGFGNASSIHQPGQQAKQVLEKARRQVASFLGCSPKEIVFTSGGTESDNLAILGVAGPGAHVVTTAMEHPAVLAACRDFDATYLRGDSRGRVSVDELRAALRPDTALVSVMHANNETGVVQDIAALGAVARAAGVPFHSDGVQGAGRIPVDLSQVDLYSISGHKLNAPKGIGALYVRQGVTLQARQVGGRHEQGRRAGTENVPGAVALGAAAAMARDWAGLAALTQRLEAGILARVPDAVVNGAGAVRVPNTTNIRFAGIEGEAMVIALDLRGFAVSSGAACSSGAVEPSHVLLALGLTREEAKSSIRFSLGLGNTEAQVDALIDAVAASAAHLRRLSPVYA